MKFLNFFGEGGQVTTANGNLAIEFGDYIILDNCTTHRFQTGDVLQRWLMHWELLLVTLDSHLSLM